MAEAPRANVFSMPAHRAFADALAVGLLRRFGKDPLGLARGIVIVPNNRAKLAIQNGFVRHSGGGLLLPRIVAIGDSDLDESVGFGLDAIDDADPLPPVVDPLRRTLILAALIARVYEREADRLDGAEALALAQALGATLDQMQLERVAPAAVDALAAEMGEDLAGHWRQSLDLFRILSDAWPRELAACGLIDLAEHRGRVLDRVAARWAAGSDAPFIVAAGLSDTAPAVAQLLRTIAFMPQGMVVFADLDRAMPQAEWDALGPHDRAGEGPGQPDLETHPQYHLKLLLDRMGIARDEVRRWQAASEADATPRRTMMASNAFAPAAFTGKWRELQSHERSLAGITALELANPAQEAQAIALAMRESLETPERTVALVTPDRALAARVAAHLTRWGIAADDSAGRPLPQTAPGALPLLIAEAAAARFAPVELMSLLKHPLVRAGDARLGWLDQVRALDMVLRGPRPANDLDGIGEFLSGEGSSRTRAARHAIAPWWREVAAILKPLETLFAGHGGGPIDLGEALAAIRETMTALAGDAVWAGPAGRALAGFFTDLAIAAPDLRGGIEPEAIATALERLMAPIAVRPPQGGHPRLFIWGLIEARLQSADLMILGGLNEGVWPQLPAPDPWLAPGIRRRLGLPGLDWRIGLSAHDFAGAIAAPEVLITRARRDAGAPTVASRFVLRLEAMAGGLPRPDAANDMAALALALDQARAREQIAQPAPVPTPDQRPRRISVTQLDRLKADPYAFYAQAVLQLSALDSLDADPTAAWRGSAVHEVLERWSKDDDHDPALLRRRARDLMLAPGANPVIRAMWEPRLLAAIDWIAETMSAQIAEGRQPILFEELGTIEIGGVMLRGKADRIDRLPAGGIAVVDYKTGQAPTPAMVRAGYSLQLGLLGLIAERGGFKSLGSDSEARAFEYWSLAKKKDSFGHIARPFAARPQPGDVAPEDFTRFAAANLIAACERWLTGDAPFTAKLAPEFAPYADYDQLMRLQEWYGI
jgi:ATP-dependent helicase/nuclease subunit B